MQVETVTTAPQTTQKVAKAKHWAGCTLNNYTPQDEARFLANIQPLADYYVYGKEVIELISIEESDSEGCDDMDILTQLGCENCENCGKNIAVCNCFEDSFIDDESYLDTDDYSEEESDDLFDI